MDRPEISVCIPVYNGENYISQTIQSVLDQTFKDFELLIVDNVSTDATLDIVKKFTDERIRVIENDKNYGMVGNWNICLREACGKYVHLLCADDLLEPECLQKQYEVIAQDKEITMVFNPTYVIDENNKITMKRRPFKGAQIFDGKQIAKKSFHSKNLYGEPSNILFRKSVSDKIGGFTEGMCYSPDWEYWIRLSLEGKVAYVDEFLMRYRIANTSATSSLIKKRDDLKEDERMLIESVTKLEGFSLTKFDVFRHQLAMKIRFMAKVVYFTIRH